MPTDASPAEVLRGIAAQLRLIPEAMRHCYPGPQGAFAGHLLVDAMKLGAFMRHEHATFRLLAEHALTRGDLNDDERHAVVFDEARTHLIGGLHWSDPAVYARLAAMVESEPAGGESTRREGRKQKPCEAIALAQYDHACRLVGRRPTLKDAYKLAKEHADGDSLPRLATWARHVRAGRKAAASQAD